MSLAPRAARPRRRSARLRTGAALGLILGSFVVGPLLAASASGQEAPTTTTTTSTTAAPSGPAAATTTTTAPTEDACAQVSTSVSLTGSSSAREALIRWGASICRSADVVADYSDFESKGGRDAVTPADAEVIGLTSLPFTKDEQAALKEQKRGVVLVPILAGSVACAYWDTNSGDPSKSGTRYPNLRLSRKTLADQTGGSPRDSSNFSPDLVADNAENPDFKVGAPFLSIEPYLRSGSSAITYELTDWFHQSRSAEQDFLKSSFEDATLPFEDTPVPTNSSPTLVNDYNTMKARMLGGLQTLGIGCMDTATARTDAKPDTPTVEALNVALLDNAAGKFVAPTDDAVRRALEAMTPNADGTYAIDWKLADPQAYVLPMLVYAAVPTCGIDAATRTSMDKVLGYALGAGQQNLPSGNVALPADVAATAKRQLAQWQKLTKAVGPCTPVAPTTTTTSTTAPEPGSSTTLPVVDDGGIGSSGGDGGVVQDPGFATGSDGGVDEAGTGGPSTGGGGGERAGGPGAGVGGGSGAGAGEGSTAPLRRIVAMASGSQALPPLLMLLTGAGLLLAGPVLQAAGGLRRPGSLPASAASWFRRLRP